MSDRNVALAQISKFKESVSSPSLLMEPPPLVGVVGLSRAAIYSDVRDFVLLVVPYYIAKHFSSMNRAQIPPPPALPYNRKKPFF